MFEACRPTGRLFYWALAVMVMAASVRVWAGEEASAGKPATSPTAKPGAEKSSARAASPAPQSGPVLTSVIDTVYMASGSPAQGVLIITWPAFVAADGTAVAPGSLDVTLGTNGALNVALTPNSNATPANTYYTVVYQLQPSEVRTEYWVVPTSSPATLAEVRTTPGSGTAAQPVSMQYVNTALAAKANDNAVVHLADAETVTGTKSFTVPPNVPTPVNTGDVANKSYVDTSIANVGAGNYLPTAGGAMTGTLTLSGTPTAPLQAADKQYVDSNIALKADLISGLVPTSELGSGAASGLNCLLGNGTWGSCGSSANATEIQSVPVGSGAPTNGQVLAYSSATGQYVPSTPAGGTGGVLVSPPSNQTIAQPVGTSFNANTFNGVRYVTASDNWSQTVSGNLATPNSAQTINLIPCPLGINTSNNPAQPYYVYIPTTNAEAALVTGGTCTSGAASGTIVVTTTVAHSASTNTIQSAYGGIQEALNDAGSPNGFVVIPPTGANTNAYQIYATIYQQNLRSTVEGYGSLVQCHTRSVCWFIGDRVASGDFASQKLKGLRFTSSVNIDGVQVTSVSVASNAVTMTAAGHPFLTGDYVATDVSIPTYGSYHGFWLISSTTTNTFTFSVGSATNVSATTAFGTAALETAAIEDNSNAASMTDIDMSSYGNPGLFNNDIVVDNDQAALIHHFDTEGGAQIRHDANWVGWGVWSRGDQGNSAVVTIDGGSNLSMDCGNGVNNRSGNFMTIRDTVIQDFSQHAIFQGGGLQGGLYDAVYEEVDCANPAYPGNLYSASGLVNQGQPATARGGTYMVGQTPQFAFSGTSGSTQRNYYLVMHSSIGAVYAIPLFAGYARTNGGAGTISVYWPEMPATSSSVDGTITYDVLLGASSSQVPVGTGNFALATAISGSCTAGICSFSDNQSAAASYTVGADPTLIPQLDEWPGHVVLAPSTDATATFALPQYFADVLPANSSSAMVAAGNAPSFHAQSCVNQGFPSIAQQVCSPQNASQSAVITSGAPFPQGGGSTSILQGSLLFEGNPATPNHFITLHDSQQQKTLANSGRLAASASDVYIGTDDTAGNFRNLSFGAPQSISFYIGNTGDNASYLERLTAALKTFNVPVTVNGNLTVTGTCTGCGGGGAGTVNSGTATQLALYAANGTAVSGDSGLTDSGTALNYAGSNGITAAAGTFSGNVTVNGQLLVAGPWMVSSPIPGTAMSAAGAGTSALGISSDGNFYISASAGTPQKVATTASSSYFSNLFQEDGYDLGQFVMGETTANPQSLHVYSSYTNSSTWQRTSVGYDLADNYAVLRSENSTAGTAPGLGFWINNGLKWVVDASSNLKPWTDQTYNVGSFNGAGGTGLRPGTVYVAGNSASGSGFELGKFASESYELCNDTTSGTIVNGLAVLTTAGCAAKPASALTSGAIGVAIANAGTSGVVTLAREGSAYCSFDGSATVVGDYVVPSGTASAGFYPLCHDAGSTRPTGTQILGRVLQASAGSTTVQMFLDMPGSNVSSSGTSAGTGSCTSQAVTAVLSGGPTCTTITSAYVDSSIAPAASPTLTGTPTAPTAAANTNTTQVATTAFVLGQASSTTPNMDGTAAVGTSNTFARADHVHPTDTSRAPLASPGLTGTPTAPTATTGDNSTKIATTAYVRSEIYLAWSCAVAGTTAVTQNCNWTVPAGITVTGFDLAASTAAAGCTTYPVLQVWDGTAGAELGSYSIAFTSGTNFYTEVAGSTNATSGHQLRFKVTTAAAGCGTNAAGVVATVTYQMQN
jgi:hypothetical protein